MGLADAAEDEIHLAPRGIDADVLEQQLRHDLVGAGEIEETDVREVDDGERAVAYSIQLLLDLATHGSAGWTSDQIRVELAHALAQHRAHVDMIDHATRSGIVICTCAPGK